MDATEKRQDDPQIVMHADDVFRRSRSDKQDMQGSINDYAIT